jgi:hypothetical protein
LHGDGNEHRANNNRDQPNTGRFITQDQIRHARKVYSGEAPLGPNPSPEELAACRFIIQEQKDQINSDKRILERRRDEANASNRNGPNDRHTICRASSIGRGRISRSEEKRATSRETWRRNSTRSNCCLEPKRPPSQRHQHISLPVRPMMMNICGTCGTLHSKESGCFKAPTSKTMRQHQGETSLQSSRLGTKQQRQQ